MKNKIVLQNTNWIPAFAGMTITGRFNIHHPLKSWNPPIIKGLNHGK